MKERPILFSGEMVRAILEGRKTQTRRIVKGIPDDMMVDGWDPDSLPVTIFLSDGGDVRKRIESPCQPGDLLWVRETFSWVGDGHSLRDLEFLRSIEAPKLVYRASGAESDHWHPSLHMPRWASRITLKVTSARVERLNDISESDALSEGCCGVEHDPCADEPGFAVLWERINGEGSWAANPWVWVIKFEHIADEIEGTES